MTTVPECEASTAAQRPCGFTAISVSPGASSPRLPSLTSRVREPAALATDRSVCDVITAPPEQEAARRLAQNELE
eukprot:CAMPEP_0179843674 /NCGR_PEP_ID=MMETSP0982-20121206/3854_1 /TAXON_ID=483367 /ORGANISM="non described non described, Strain CCMP 2436" /LENGTH=74 /DNA_ID=CAMNT_0021728165 /DNA_START=265 /DNA_END=489 /DNA_ORIENTATION=+